MGANLYVFLNFFATPTLHIKQGPLSLHILLLVKELPFVTLMQIHLVNARMVHEMLFLLAGDVDQVGQIFVASVRHRILVTHEKVGVHVPETLRLIQKEAFQNEFFE